MKEIHNSYKKKAAAVIIVIITISLHVHGGIGRICPSASHFSRVKFELSTTSTLSFSIYLESLVQKKRLRHGN